MVGRSVFWPIIKRLFAVACSFGDRSTFFSFVRPEMWFFPAKNWKMSRPHRSLEFYAIDTSAKVLISSIGAQKSSNYMSWAWGGIAVNGSPKMISSQSDNAVHSSFHILRGNFGHISYLAVLWPLYRLPPYQFEQCLLLETRPVCRYMCFILLL